MSTMTRAETQTVTGTDVRQVAEAIWQEVLAIYDFYGRRFPYDKPQLRSDLGQILLWDMCDAIKVEFYENQKDQKVERLSYEFLPLSDPGAVQEAPGTFPRFQIQASWQVRLIARYTTRKPEAEVLEFYRELGWRLVEPLTRTGRGLTEWFSWFRSGGFSVHRGVYKDFDEPTSGKEVAR
jgi:hypothetical protein